jgi:hypothetical protein
MLESLQGTFGDAVKQGTEIINSDTPLQTAINKVLSVIISPKESNFDGIKLDAVTEETITVEVEYATDVLDNGNVITQHSVLKPRIVTLRGIVANRVLSVPPVVDGVQTQANSKITQLERYAPGLTGNLLAEANKAASFVKGAIGYIDQATVFLKETVGIFKDFFPAGTPATSKFIAQIYALEFARKPVKITHIGIVYDNFRITRFTPKQDNENGLIDISLEFTEIFETSSNYANVNKRVLSNAISSRAANIEKKGLTEGTKENISSLKRLKNASGL